jgi:hypothetical protein
MLTLMTAALVAAQPVPNAPVQLAQAPQGQMAPMGEHPKKEGCCKDCCKDMAGKEHGERAGDGSNHAGHSAH